MSKHFNVAVEGDDGGLVICRGCKARGTYAALPSGECPTPYKPNSVLLKESLAREQALQQRLTAADERADVLDGLIGEVLDAVGREPLDLDAVLRLRARMRAALKPAEAPRNQCDGCQAGIPLINGTHRMGREGGYPDMMSCTAKMYESAECGDDE